MYVLVHICLFKFRVFAKYLHLLIHHQFGEYDIPFVKDRIAKFMIDRLVH